MKKWFKSKKNNRIYDTSVLLVHTNTTGVDELKASLLRGVALIESHHSMSPAAIVLLVGENEGLIMEQASRLVFEGYNVEVCISSEDKALKLKKLQNL